MLCEISELPRPVLRGDYAAVQNFFSGSRRAWLWPLLVAAMIFLASTRSQVAAPSVEGSDKIAHFSVYGLLATLVVRLIARRQFAWVAVIITSAYGVSDEWHQSFTPGRSVEVADWLADTMGATLAVGLYVFWPLYRRFLEAPVVRQRRVENRAPAATVSRG